MSAPPPICPLCERPITGKQDARFHYDHTTRTSAAYHSACEHEQRHASD